MNNSVESCERHPDIGIIEVSTFGRVRTLDRVVPRGKYTQFVKGLILKQYDNGNGYLHVVLSMNGKTVTKKVHRLVAETFISNPDNLTEVNHKDCNRANNNVENLEWCTRSYNRQYREKYGVSQTEALGNPVFAINLETLEVSHFRSQSEASRELGVFKQNVNNVIKGIIKQTGGYLFVSDDGHSVDVVNHKIK